MFVYVSLPKCTCLRVYVCIYTHLYTYIHEYRCTCVIVRVVTSVLWNKGRFSQKRISLFYQKLLFKRKINYTPYRQQNVANIKYQYIYVSQKNVPFYNYLQNTIR